MMNDGDGSGQEKRERREREGPGSGNLGKPNEEGLYNDAKSAIIWLKKLGLTEKDIVIYGESLGSGVATEIAQNSNFAGLVLETPFTSMIDAAKNFYPYIPVSLLFNNGAVNLCLSYNDNTEDST